MRHSKVDITHLDQIRIKLDNIQNVFTSKRVTSQTFLDFGQNFQMHRIRSIQKVHESAVFVTETVEKVLGENPADVTVNGFLDWLGFLIS